MFTLHHLSWRITNQNPYLIVVFDISNAINISLISQRAAPLLLHRHLRCQHKTNTKGTKELDVLPPKSNRPALVLLRHRLRHHRKTTTRRHTRQKMRLVTPRGIVLPPHCNLQGNERSQLWNTVQVQPRRNMHIVPTKVIVVSPRKDIQPISKEVPRRNMHIVPPNIVIVAQVLLHHRLHHQHKTTTTKHTR